MGYLHKNKEEFTNAVNLASMRFHILPTVVEKDYYVTMILRELSQRMPFIVFKGGTCLSKCYRVIRRFSEDIDIAVDTRITQTQMKKLKEAVREVSSVLGMSIPNIAETRSRRDYNRYIIQYESVTKNFDEIIQEAVLLETTFSEVSFPTVILPVHSYIGDLMQEEAPDALKEYFLDSFDMKVQGIDRTLADKVFALCDYYLENRVEKHSRHIYDIYKLLPLVPQDSGFRKLVCEVRNTRAHTRICPSAGENVNVPELLKDIIEKEIYKKDYENITSRLLEETVTYETAVKAIKVIAESDIFEEVQQN